MNEIEQKAVRKDGDATMSDLLDKEIEELTKQKQIEEMARKIAKRDCYLFEKCPKEPKHNCLSQDPSIMFESSKPYITFATWLFNAGYRNVKDKVVLDKEEYEKGRTEREWMRQNIDEILNENSLLKEELRQASELKAETIKLAKQEIAREIIEFARSFFTYDEEGFVKELEEQYGVEAE